MQNQFYVPVTVCCNHSNVAAIAECYECGRGLCNECHTQFGNGVCLDCMEKKNEKEFKGYLIGAIIAFVISMIVLFGTYAKIFQIDIQLAKGTYTGTVKSGVVYGEDGEMIFTMTEDELEQEAKYAKRIYRVIPYATFFVLSGWYLGFRILITLFKKIRRNYSCWVPLFFYVFAVVAFLPVSLYAGIIGYIPMLIYMCNTRKKIWELRSAQQTE